MNFLNFQWLDQVKKISFGTSLFQIIFHRHFEFTSRSTNFHSIGHSEKKNYSKFMEIQ